MIIKRKLLAIMAVAVLSVGCATVETESWQNCAIAGALVGGASGAFVDGAAEVVAGSVIGAGVGYTLCGNPGVDMVGTVEPDGDGDGVVASRDQCPNTPEGTKVDAKGCALNLDDDNDGVANAKDLCPDSEKGARVNSLGCIDKWVFKGVNFHSNSAALTDDAKAILKPFALLHSKEHANTQVLISGHTDSIGSIAKNEILSKNRAAAVKEYLMSQGSSEAMISTVGLGEAKPVASNSTAAGRAKNRRVELSVKE